MPASAGFGGLFGPSNEAECIEAFATQGITRRVVRSIYYYCGVAFNSSAHPIVRDRSRCLAEGFSDIKSEDAGAAVMDVCTRKYPSPRCPAGSTFSFSEDRCMVNRTSG